MSEISKQRNRAAQRQRRKQHDKLSARRSQHERMPEQWQERTVGSARVLVKPVSDRVMSTWPVVKRTVTERTFMEVLLGKYVRAKKLQMAERDKAI